MPDIEQRDSAITDDHHDHETPERISGPTLLLAALAMLKPYVSYASIELNTNIKVLLRKDETPRIVLHCANAAEPCKNLQIIRMKGVEPFAVCHELASSQKSLITGRRHRRAFELEPQVGSRTLPVLPSGAVSQLHQLSQLVETPELRQHVLGLMRTSVEKLLSSAERENLLSVFGEEEIGAFLERDNNLKRIQAIQYKCTRRINMIRMRAKKSAPCRPVIEQHKVGDYLYKLQPGQKGGDYWYLQYSLDGKRHHIYLGKNRPSFDPEKDLAEKQKVKALTAHN